MTSLDGQTIGFIGLGLMGRPMSLNLKKAGAQLVVHDLQRQAVDEMAAQGMIVAETPAAVAAQAQTVIIMVSDTPAVEAVVGGEGGLLGAIGPDSLVIDMGTTAVSATRRLAAAVAGAGGLDVGAPVSGGSVGAEGGTLTIMAGGSEDAVKRATPLFESPVPVQV